MGTIIASGCLIKFLEESYYLIQLGFPLLNLQVILTASLVAIYVKLYQLTPNDVSNKVYSIIALSIIAITIYSEAYTYFILDAANTISSVLLLIYFSSALFISHKKNILGLKGFAISGIVLIALSNYLNKIKQNKYIL